MGCDVITGVVYEDTTFSLMGRIDVAGANAVQADISAITMYAWNKADLATELIADSLTVASVVFDTLQTDGRWAEDNTGYNFRYDVASTVCTTAGQYLFRAEITGLGLVGVAIWDNVNVLALLGTK